ncbi:MAG: CapA family protein [Pseudonocardiales bacterium]
MPHRPAQTALSALVVAATLVACTGQSGHPGASRAPLPHTATPPTASSHAPSAAPAGFSIAATGDLLPHEPVVAAAARAAGGNGYDFRPLFAEVRPILSRADLAICHVETPLSADDRSLSYYPDFQSPHELAAAVRWAGFDTCTTASNHTMDQGPAGVRHTLDALDAAGVQHVGAARSAAEAARPHFYTVRGYRIAHLDYTYGLNGHRVPVDQPWLVPLIDASRILRDARTARAAGARFVIVSFHWGTEYVSAPNSQQRTLARQLLGSPDIDLLLGSHTHVLQPIERINDKFVVFGMGNFLARHSACCDTPQTSDGVIVNITVREVGGRLLVSRLTYTPTLVDRATLAIVPLAERLATHRQSPPRDALVASWARTVSRIDQLGAAEYGVLPDSVPPGLPSR